jgi:methylated-DNA-[protein]-cysteine S-methyltransferase
VQPIHQAVYSSPIGDIEVTGTRQGILSVRFSDEKIAASDEIPGCLSACFNQLDEYFVGKRKTFSVPLQLQGTDFEKQVWNALLDIPWGETRSYGEIARATGHSKAFRAVGNTNHKNKIAIIIPCHRVIGGDGSLTGYAGGLWRKKWLLAHEQDTP